MIRVVPKVNYCRVSVRGPGIVGPGLRQCLVFLAHVRLVCASGIGGGRGVNWHSLCGVVTPGFASWRPFIMRLIVAHGFCIRVCAMLYGLLFVAAPLALGC